jgi:hypothetical protein
MRDQNTMFNKVHTFFQTFWKELIKICSHEWNYFKWMERHRYERNWQSWLSVKYALQGTILCKSFLCSGFITGNVISRGSPSSCTFVTSIFISISWFLSWQDVRHVQLRTWMRFSKSAITFSVMTGLSLQEISILSL